MITKIVIFGGQLSGHDWFLMSESGFGHLWNLFFTVEVFLRALRAKIVTHYRSGAFRGVGPLVTVINIRTFFIYIAPLKEL